MNSKKEFPFKKARRLVLAWLKREAKKRGVPYQTIINQTLARAVDKLI